jgi:hypothetical protein
MPEDLRMNRPQQPQMRSDAPMMQDGYYRRRGPNMSWIIIAVVIIVLVVLGVLFRDKLFSNKSDSDSGKTSGYQAVFLTNGQVYFGKLTDSGSYAMLKDIYYLQVTQPPLQGSQATGTTTQQSSTAQPQLSLVKLGNELHGPIDEMKINRDQILFFEDMKEDGRVMQAIREYQKNPPATNGSTQQTPATQTPATSTQQNTNQ